MQIHVDLRCLQDPDYARRGVGLHTASLLAQRHAHLPPGTRLTGLLDPAMPPLPESYRGLVDETRPSPHIAPNRPGVFLEASPMTHDPLLFAGLLDRPFILSCALVYDFIPLDLEQQYLPTALRHSQYLGNLSWLRLYDLFFPISHYSARRLREILSPPPERVEMTGACVRFTRNAHGDSAPPSKYYLLVAGADRRKNPEVVLAAHAGLDPRLLTELVVVGLPEAQAVPLRQLYAEMGGDVERLHFRYGLPDEELAQLYAHSLATICSSRIEGFSLPVVEAMACGAPVLASSIDAHRELVLQPDALFDPDDAARLTRLMEQFLCDPGARRSLIEQQRPVPGELTAEKVAGRFWRRVLQEFHVRFQARTPRCTTSKPRLAILSPFPPDRSGVAEYTAACIPELSRHAVIDVYTDSPASRPCEGVRRFAPISPWPYVSGEYDRVLGVVGNSLYHTRILELHNRFGGPCLVHDNCLAELYCCWRGLDAFTRMASRSFGREVTPKEAAGWIDNPGQVPGIFFDEILLRADPLLLHSRGIQRQVVRQYGRDAEYVPFCCYRHFQEDELTAQARAAARQRLGLPPDQLAIISLGLINSHKGGEECLCALEHLHAWGLHAHLYFVGEASAHRAALVALASQLRLESFVHLFDRWIAPAEYRDYLLAADFAIQLRKQLFGGLSGAVLDCITAGLPTVANADLALSMDGPDYVLRVPDHLSPLLIAEQIADAHRAGVHRQRQSEPRTAYVREHSFDRYAERLMHALGLAG